MDRDLATLADVADRAVVVRLLQAIGATSSAELNIEQLSSSMGVPATTLRRHVELLETLFLIRRVPAWSSNLLSRSIKRPKVHVTDTGLLAYLVGADERRIEADLHLGGMFYESFVAMELYRQSPGSTTVPSSSTSATATSARSTSSSSTVTDRSPRSKSSPPRPSTSRDFRGLALLRDKLGNAFKAGALLYTVPTPSRSAIDSPPYRSAALAAVPRRPRRSASSRRDLHLVRAPACRRRV